jgi:hypothetical protein
VGIGISTFRDQQEMKKTNEEMYLDWVNNFLTVERFAEYYSMTVVQATSLIESEKEWRDAIHEKRMLCGETDGREDDEE